MSIKEKKGKKHFDYIVIGAGTAGGIIAKELTDDKRTSVLVLEAGTNMVAAFSDPSRAASGLLSSDNKFSLGENGIVD
nr:GMC family oxidoreductase N-terminal domain-containing protein [Metabacillus idriensis]